MSTQDLGLWIDNVLSHTGMRIVNYLRDRDPADLEEAKLGVQSLLAMLEEVERRP